jgi:hypothetical protein
MDFALTVKEQQDSEGKILVEELYLYNFLNIILNGLQEIVEENTDTITDRSKDTYTEGKGHC